MKPQEVREAMEEGAVLLDMRPPKPFAKEHVEGAVNVQFNRADLAERAELSMPREPRYIVHAEPEPIATAAVKILRNAGFEVAGHLEGGLEAWKEAGLPTAQLPFIDVDTLHHDRVDYRVLDVREGWEFRFNHVPGAEQLEWSEDWDEMAELTDDKPLALICGDQVRSAYVASILQRAGRDAVLVFGGMADWLERDYPLEKTPKED